MQVDVRLLPGGGSYTAEVGGERVGRLDLSRHDGAIAYTHTEVDPRFEGRGVGGALVRVALDDARSEGAKVVPLCSFVSAWIRKHPEYADLVKDT
ncbi:GNAT family N-acetyltransferase [Streptosporangium sandarakinum]|uniref:N-acetyltransferase domain-containing protein n=1 Tax=Streptosporangium sandarakinum TaxID=1260955 RepID=A0A852V520_9ACTN|nr:GNAT family N-acetyltransferase [Streptosporangium sandarakinum]NYF41035.1 hypothetical protein [Streptosporangium sandarakinum]